MKVDGNITKAGYGGVLHGEIPYSNLYSQWDIVM